MPSCLQRGVGRDPDPRRKAEGELYVKLHACTHAQVRVWIWVGVGDGECMWYREWRVRREGGREDRGWREHAGLKKGIQMESWEKWWFITDYWCKYWFIIDYWCECWFIIDYWCERRIKKIKKLIILYVNCFGRTMLYMCIEYHI